MTELVIDADKYIENYNAYKDYTSNNQYDFFISHASEDKENIALPLFQILRQFGFKVWFDQAQISIGDSLVEKIQDGLSHSRYGIIIISKSFFAKKENWTKRELDALLMRDISIANTILPIWHEVEFSYVFEHSPLIASKYAIHFKKGINYVIGEILKKAEIENIIPPPIKLLAFFWRPSINKAYHTRGADVFCIVSKFFFNPKVYLHLHNNLIHESREMTYYKDLSFKLRKYSYHVYSTFIGAGENDINNFIAKASVSMTTDFGEFQDDNNSSLYLTTHMVPEFINYDAMFITQQPWMNQEIRKWTHNNEKLLGYGGRPI
jgi:hypothetical protein